MIYVLLVWSVPEGAWFSLAQSERFSAVEGLRDRLEAVTDLHLRLLHVPADEQGDPLVGGDDLEPPAHGLFVRPDACE